MTDFLRSPLTLLCQKIGDIQCYLDFSAFRKDQAA